jgi:hypothetical protein
VPRTRRCGDPVRYGDPAAAVTSAPFEDSLASDDPEKRGGFLKSDPKRRNDPGLTATYGDAAAVTSQPYEATPLRWYTISHRRSQSRRLRTTHGFAYR